MAKDINGFFLQGRLTKAAELKYPRQDFPVVNFTIATNESKKNGDQWEDRANYFDVTFTGNYAKAIAPSLSKGMEVFIEGHAHQDRWEKDNQKYSRVVFIAENVRIGKAPKGTQPAAGNDNAPAYQQSQPAPEEGYSEDEIPFN